MMGDRKIKSFEMAMKRKSLVTNDKKRKPFVDKVPDYCVTFRLDKQLGRGIELIEAYHDQATSKIAQQKAQEAFRQARDALPEYREYQHALETYRQDRNRYETAKANIDKDIREDKCSGKYVPPSDSWIIDREFEFDERRTNETKNNTQGRSPLWIKKSVSSDIIDREFAEVNE